MASRTYPGIVVYGLALLCAAGWGAAWWQHSHVPQAQTVAAAADPGRGGAKPSRDRQERDRSIAETLHNPRSARLFTQLAELSKDAKPGEVNQAWVNACRATLMDNDPDSRRRDFSMLLEQMRPIDGPAIHQLFLALHREGRPLGEYTTFANRWGEVDGGGALSYLLAQKPFGPPARDFEAITRAWATQDPQAALAWADSHPDETASLGGKHAMIEGWIRMDPTAATQWLSRAGLDQETVAEAVGGGLHEQMRGPGTTAAVTWLAGLPDTPEFNTAASYGWQQNLNDFTSMPYADAAEAWSKVGGKSWMSFDQFEQFSKIIGKTRTASHGVQGFLDELPNHWPAEQVTSTFQRWAETSGEEVGAWIQQAPPSATRTAAIQAMIQSTAQSDPSAAATWKALLKQDAK